MRYVSKIRLYAPPSVVEETCKALEILQKHGRMKTTYTFGAWRTKYRDVVARMKANGYTAERIKQFYFMSELYDTVAYRQRGRILDGTYKY